MVDYSTLSFVMRGKRRKEVLLCLEKPKIPKDISFSCKISIHNVSKSLKELLEKGLIKCENPKDKFYRFYSLTQKGKDTLKELKIIK